MVRRTSPCERDLQDLVPVDVRDPDHLAPIGLLHEAQAVQTATERLAEDPGNAALGIGLEEGVPGVDTEVDPVLGVHHDVAVGLADVHARRELQPARDPLVGVAPLSHPDRRLRVRREAEDPGSAPTACAAIKPTTRSLARIAVSFSSKNALPVASFYRIGAQRGNRTRTE